MLDSQIELLRYDPMLYVLSFTLGLIIGYFVDQYWDVCSDWFEERKYRND